MGFASNIRSRQLAISSAPLGSLEVRRGHARAHSKDQVRVIAKSLSHFGWVNPIVIDASGAIICGVGRYLAAKQLNLPEVPVVRIDDMSEADKRAYALADNAMAEMAGWDAELLKMELQFLSLPEFDLDLDLTGFGERLDQILGPSDLGGDAPPPPLDRGAIISRPGDLWMMGEHRLLCGDARDPQAYARLLGGERARLVLTDPPYNLPILGYVSGRGAKRHGDFSTASGEMDREEFTAFLRVVMEQLAEASCDGSIHMFFMDWRHMPEILAAGEGCYSEFKSLCVWAKDNPGLGSFYRSQHELVFVFKNGAASHVSHLGPGKGGRIRSNVWSYAGANQIGPERGQELDSHPTCKPVPMLTDAILDCSRRRDLILDPFCGSGSLILAAEQVGRRAAAIEIDPAYVDVAIRRVQKATGVVARLEDGRTFDDVARDRLPPSEGAR